MMTEWDDFEGKTCPLCRAAMRVPAWPSSGEYGCTACGKYKGYAWPNLRRSPLVSGMVRLVDCE